MYRALIASLLMGGCIQLKDQCDVDSDCTGAQRCVVGVCAATSAPPDAQTDGRFPDPARDHGPGDLDGGTRSDAAPDGARDANVECVPEEGPDTPDDALNDSNCDGIDGDRATAIFVSPDGQDVAGDGSPERPFRSLRRAVSEANDREGHQSIYLDAGEYAEAQPLQLQGVSIYGGYRNTDGGWRRTGVGLAQATIRSTAPRALVFQVGDQDAVLDSVTVISGPGTHDLVDGRPDVTSAALTATSGAGSLTLRHVRLEAGAGAPGIDGTNSADSDRVGAPGLPGDLNGLGGGRARDMPTPCGSRGGNGGGALGPGDPGECQGAGCVRAAGGSVRMPNGGDGEPAAHGAEGLPAINSGHRVGARWLPVRSGEGRVGVAGGGAGGGAGGVGSRGGGGGAGGCGGPPGPPGFGGGGSFALIVHATTVVIGGDSELIAGDGGRGGDPGRVGAGALGGAGAAGAAGAGRGGTGGRGGCGGSGGPGPGGPSAAILELAHRTAVVRFESQDAVLLQTGLAGAPGEAPLNPACPPPAVQAASGVRGPRLCCGTADGMDRCNTLSPCE